jgi:hypothetical protein
MKRAKKDSVKRTSTVRGKKLKGGRHLPSAKKRKSKKRKS